MNKTVYACICQLLNSARTQLDLFLHTSIYLTFTPVAEYTTLFFCLCFCKFISFTSLYSKHGSGLARFLSFLAALATPSMFVCLCFNSQRHVSESNEVAVVPSIQKGRLTLTSQLSVTVTILARKMQVKQTKMNLTLQCYWVEKT